MQPETTSRTIQDLQAQYPVFEYTACTVTSTVDTVTVEYTFTCGDLVFHPQIKISTIEQKPVGKIDPELLRYLAFHAGMSEIASYWKATCSPQIQIKAGVLADDQIVFWRELLFNGMGEFFVVNNLEPFSPQITIDSNASAASFALPTTTTAGHHILIPVGGGKDSAVSLSLLAHANIPLSSLIIGSDVASYSIVDAFTSKHPLETRVRIDRTIDPMLLELNTKGYLNGHTPFSSVVAFCSLLASYLYGFDWIALSNERSANEPSMVYKGMPVNHQYTKSVAFEQDFRTYVEQTFGTNVQYFSFLRPLYELQVAKLFASMLEYHSIFRSCNVGQKENKWCGACSKCLFVGVILSAFLDQSTIQHIFGKDLLDDSALKDILTSIIDEQRGKPFECIGTRLETKTALYIAYRKIRDAHGILPALLQQFEADFQEHASEYEAQAHQLLHDFDSHHFVPSELEGILHEALEHTTE